jgi:uncharacterized BrkB/YihY/UPF0761 family membrane protein
MDLIGLVIFLGIMLVTELFSGLFSENIDSSKFEILLKKAIKYSALIIILVLMFSFCFKILNNL